MPSSELQKPAMLLGWWFECLQKCLNTWSPGDSIVWVNLGDVALLEKMDPWGAGFEGFCVWFGLGGVSLGNSPGVKLHSQCVLSTSGLQFRM